MSQEESNCSDEDRLPRISRVMSKPEVTNVQPARVQTMDPRLKQIEVMLNRAHERGEHAPPVSEILDHLLAPLYVRALFGTPGDRVIAAGLVDDLLRMKSNRDCVQ